LAQLRFDLHPVARGARDVLRIAALPDDALEPALARELEELLPSPIDVLAVHDRAFAGQHRLERRLALFERFVAQVASVAVQHVEDDEGDRARFSRLACGRNDRAVLAALKRRRPSASSTTISPSTMSGRSENASAKFASSGNFGVRSCPLRETARRAVAVDRAPARDSRPT
jgi:hypothetical protein